MALTESVHVGAGGINIGIIGGGGGGIIGGRGGGSVQHGGPTCACTIFGVLTPAKKEMTIPKRSVATTAITPIRIGVFCKNIDVFCFILFNCIERLAVQQWQHTNQKRTLVGWVCYAHPADSDQIVIVFCGATSMSRRHFPTLATAHFHTAHALLYGKPTHSGE